MSTMYRVALLHGASYVGGELIRLLEGHPHLHLSAVTSRTFAGQPVWEAHPHLRGQTDQCFMEGADAAVAEADALLVAAEHGRSAQLLPELLAGGFEGAVVDLSADFRYTDPVLYEKWFDYIHPEPSLLDRFAYGLPEVNAPYGVGVRYVANPGCFATGLALSLYPLAAPLAPLRASVTALTGASGSGTRPKASTHFPTRDGNVRAYKVMAHQHLPEVKQVLGAAAEVAFVPASGPWTRGIWGTAHVALPADIDEAEVGGWYGAAYAEEPFVRMQPGLLPELRSVVNTPFCDLGWTVKENQLVVGFALDNLLKGAASQAIHNLNLLLGVPETSGLLPASLSVEHTLQPTR